MENFGISVIMIASTAYVLSILLSDHPIYRQAIQRFNMDRMQFVAILFLIILTIDNMFRSNVDAYIVWSHLRNMFGGLGMGWAMMRIMGSKM